MNNNHNSYCAICGNSYYYCHSCKDQARLHPYKIHTDTSEHFKVFTVVRGYSVGLYTKEEANKLLKNIDISDMDTYKDNIKSVLNEILKIELKEVKNVDVIQEESTITATPTIENNDVVSVVEEVNLETKVTTNANINTRKNKKQFRYNKNEK